MTTECVNCYGAIVTPHVCDPCRAEWPEQWPELSAIAPSPTPDTLRDCAAILARTAELWHDHPDTVPDSWPVSEDWPTGVRRRAARVGHVAQLLAQIAEQWGDQ